MPRSQARISTKIWGDPDFVSLPGSAQRLYLMLLSQPTLQLCGVLPYQPNRWAATCADDTPECLVESLALLEEKRFVVVDLTTDEVLIRSLMRNDGVRPDGNPKLWKAARDQAEMVASGRIRAAIAEEVRRMSDCDENEPRSESDRTVNGQSPVNPAVENHAEIDPGLKPDSPRVRARASTLHPPPSDYRPPSSSGGDDDVTEEALELLAQIKLKRRQAEVGRVGNARSWLNAAKNADRRDLAESIALAPAGMTAEQLAAWLDSGGIAQVSAEERIRDDRLRQLRNSLAGAKKAIDPDLDLIADLEAELKALGA